MTTVKNAMTPSCVSVTPDLPIDVAIQRMLDQNVSGLPVVDQHGSLVGVISEFDVLGLCGRRGDAYDPYAPCERFMTRTVRTIQQDASLETAARIFQAASIRRLFVLDGDRLAGVLSRRDVVRHIRQERLGASAASDGRSGPSAPAGLQAASRERIAPSV